MHLGCPNNHTNVWYLDLDYSQSTNELLFFYGYIILKYKRLDISIYKYKYSLLTYLTGAKFLLT